MIKIMTTRTMFAEILMNILLQKLSQEIDITIVDHDTIPLTEKFETLAVAFSETPKSFGEISQLFRSTGIKAYVMSPCIDVLVRVIEMVSAVKCDLIVGTPCNKPMEITLPVGPARLSPKEIMVVESLAKGESNKVIARKLDIAEATIKVHVKSVLRKLNLTNRTQAAMWWSSNRTYANGEAV